MQEAAQVRDELKEVVMQQVEEAISKTSSTAVTHGIKVCAKRCAGWVWARLRKPAMSCGVAGPAVALKPLSHAGTRASTPEGFSGLAAQWEAACKLPALARRGPLY